jgi:hypothetical protein
LVSGKLPRIRKGSFYLRPIQLVICETRLVETPEQAEDVRVFVQLAQILTMLVQRARLVPARRNAWVVLPLVEELQVLWILPVHCL